MNLILLGIAVAVISNVLMGWKRILWLAVLGFVIGVVLCMCGIVDWVLFERPIWGNRFS